ncbi:hypothetical protein CYMTET_48584 [Cymbomonas tetramitiformis]|uniref:Uncharacterized protein n=1 Tax=Cymbomonas tetramitiformis TaxID=36881 RepID=A0AAE0EUU5_9CHLO|nr:hypothetical protein CYMTET_48584 [Cymbomonas tetramitiformis]
MTQSKGSNRHRAWLFCSVMWSASSASAYTQTTIREALAEAKRASLRCEKFVVFTREGGGAEHYISALNTHPHVSVVDEVFGTRREEVLDGLFLHDNALATKTLDEWADDVWHWAAARKGYTTTHPVKCALGVKMIDYEMGGMETVRMFAEDQTIRKIVMQRYNVTEEWSEVLAARSHKIRMENASHYPSPPYPQLPPSAYSKSLMQLAEFNQANESLYNASRFWPPFAAPPEAPPSPPNPEHSPPPKAYPSGEDLQATYDPFEPVTKHKRREKLLGKSLSTSRKRGKRGLLAQQAALSVSGDITKDVTKLHGASRRSLASSPGKWRGLLPENDDDNVVQVLRNDHGQRTTGRWPHVTEPQRVPKCRVQTCMLADYLPLNHAWYRYLADLRREALHTPHRDHFWLHLSSEECADSCLYPSALKRTIQFLQMGLSEPLSDCAIYRENSCRVITPAQDVCSQSDPRRRSTMIAALRGFSVT